MQAHLINKQGCTFDSATFSTTESARAWARGRGGNCTLVIHTDKFTYTYQVRGNRTTLLDCERNEAADLDRQFGKEE